MFDADVYRLAGPSETLRRTTAADAHLLGPACAAIDPWKSYGVDAERMTTNLLPPPGPGTHRFSIVTTTGEVAGVMAVRTGWLAGPYIQFLCVLPGHQGRGIGAAALALAEAVAREAGSRNLWICVTSTNRGAQALYRRSGFREVAPLPDLLADGIDELLMRKRLPPDRTCE